MPSAPLHHATRATLTPERSLHVHVVAEDDLSGVSVGVHSALWDATLPGVVVSSSGVAHQLPGNTTYGKSTYSTPTIQSALPEALRQRAVEMKPHGPACFAATDAGARAGRDGFPAIDLVLCCDAVAHAAVTEHYRRLPVVPRLTRPRAICVVYLRGHDGDAARLGGLYAALVREVVRASSAPVDGESSGAETAIACGDAWDDGVERVVDQFAKMRNTDVVFTVV